MNFLRKALLSAALGLLSGAALAGSYPDKPVRVVVGFAAGGPVDIVARISAEHLAAALGQNVIVENRAGAGGQIATQFIAQAPADGYTLLMTSSNAHGAGPALWKQVPYDPMKDFTHLALMAQAPIVLVAKANSPMNDLADVIKTGKADPAALNFGSGGAGGMGHLTGEVLQSEAGFTMTHVPYKGSSAALTDLVGGQIDLISDVMASYVPQVQAGAVKFLGVSTRERVSQFPDVKTFAEQGYPDAVTASWFGLTAPAGLPPEVVAKLTDAVAKTLDNPKVKARFAELGLIIDPARANSPAFTKFVQSELARWKQVAQERDLHVN